MKCGHNVCRCVYSQALSPSLVMSTTAATRSRDQLLTHPGTHSNVLTGRAKAFIFSDPLSRALLQEIEQVARADAPVLITGETGTGKELVARHLHDQSGRKGEFVAVNCGALPHSLAEAELFGHQAGSFTGATETRAGWFESATGGTLFLDEVGDLPLSIQVKLLRVLQEREVVRIGSRRPILIDVRVVAATNIDLSEAVIAGRFRQDLYYRLNVIRLTVPPLSARPGDILPLAEHFLGVYQERLQTEAAVLTPEARRLLQNYRWPGNIRELENVIHRALLTAQEGVIRPENLRLEGALEAVQVAADSDARAASSTLGAPLDTIAAQLDRLFSDPPSDLLGRIEELVVSRAYAHAGSNQMQAARLLGISRNALRTLLRRFNLITPV